jgi:hypothetical protein
MRGSERGARTIAMLPSRPKASLPCSSTTMLSALVEDARERMRRVEPERRQHRQDLVVEIFLQPALLLGVPLDSRVQHADAFARRAPGAASSFQQRYWRLDQFGGASWIVAARFREGVRRAARGRRTRAVAHRGDADLEEFVEVGAGDAQEAQSLQQRHALILRLRQHAEIELELRQFAVDVQRRVAQVARCLLMGGAARESRRARRVARSYWALGRDAFAAIRASPRVRARGRRPKWQAKVLPRPTSLSMSSRA